MILKTSNQNGDTALQRQKLNFVNNLNEYCENTGTQMRP